MMEFTQLEKSVNNRYRFLCVDNLWRRNWKFYYFFGFLLRERKIRRVVKCNFLKTEEKGWTKVHKSSNGSVHWLNDLLFQPLWLIIFLYKKPADLFSFPMADNNKKELEPTILTLWIFFGIFDIVFHRGILLVLQPSKRRL